LKITDDVMAFDFDLAVAHKATMIEKGGCKTKAEKKKDFDLQFSNLIMAKNKADMIRQGKYRG
jgi:hypothetical protein